MSGGVRIEGHLRGHVASCNGRVELVGAIVEPHSCQDSVSSLNLRELQARSEETRRRKKERLLAFQKDVKERVRRREQDRLRQLSDTANRQPLKPKRLTPGTRRKVCSLRQCVHHYCSC